MGQVGFVPQRDVFRELRSGVVLPDEIDPSLVTEDSCGCASVCVRKLNRELSRM